ncbi:hypothetical protein GCM10010420_10720 [Streptomyces glaucosporus]|uniref:Secreted protein n=1 Tax=Streptomyces glaucosporus TaxID=284044 RepID=A0ABN3HWS2_9ACTN
MLSVVAAMSASPASSAQSWERSYQASAAAVRPWSWAIQARNWACSDASRTTRSVRSPRAPECSATTFRLLPEQSGTAGEIESGGSTR